MRILQLTKKFPYPLKDGESLAIHYIAKGLQEVGCTISLLSFNTLKHYSEVESQTHMTTHYENVWSVDIDTSLEPWKMFKNLWTQDSYNIERFIDLEYQDLLTEILATEDFDIVQLEGLYLTPYIKTIKKVSKAKVVMRSHNHESEIFSDLARGTNNLLKKSYYDLCAKRLRNHEISIMASYDLLVSISEDDHKKYSEIGYSGKKICVPVGMEFTNQDKVTKDFNSKKLTFGFLGSLDWQPNVEGLKWFLPLWQKFHTSTEVSSFHIAGRGGSSTLFPDFRHCVNFHGEIDDAKTFMDSLDILVVPLFSGSGIRVKIIEALARGKVVLSTSKGFEGIGVTHLKDALVFDSKEELEELLDKVKDLDRQALSQNAINLARSKFHYIELAQDLKKEYSDILQPEGIHI